MYSYDFYTGEPSNDGSPPMSQSEIVNNANLTGGYYTDPQQRLAQQQQQPYGGYYNPGYYGYNNPQQSGFGNYMNTPQQNNGFQGYCGNPAFQYLQNRGMHNGYGNQPVYNTYQQPVQQNDYTYFVPGFNPGGSNLLLPKDAEEICDQLQMEMMEEQEEAYVKRMEKQRGYMESQGYNGYNYYGLPYANPYQNDASITTKYKNRIEEMRKEAEQARLDLNKRLSRAAHMYVYGNVDEEQLNRVYDGQYVTVPGTTIEYDRQQEYFDHLVPFNNAEMYRQRDAEISKEYTKYFTEGGGMADFFENAGQIIADDLLEQEEHNRRDMTNLYKQDGSYKQLLRRKIKEKYNMEHGVSGNNGEGYYNNPPVKENIPFGGYFPTLNESAQLLDDGTLNIKLPERFGEDKTLVIKNAQQDEYELKRSQFIDSIYRDNPKPGGGGPHG